VVEPLLRLRLAGLAGILRRPRDAARVALLIGLAVVLGVIATVALLSLRTTTVEIAHAATVGVGGVILIGSALAPLALASDDPWDARRYALFGIPAGRLAFALGVSTVVSAPAVVGALLGAVTVSVWTRDSAALVWALAMVPVAIITFSLTTRVVSATASRLFSGRRTREAVAVIVWAAVAIIAPTVAVLATSGFSGVGVTLLRRLSAVLEWTPFGALWSVPGDAAAGDSSGVAAKLAIALGWIVLLGAAWLLLVRRQLTSVPPERPRRAYAGLGWFRVLPATGVFAVAARSINYWGRDPRYRIMLISVPLIPIVPVLALAAGGVPVEVLLFIPVPMAALFFGWVLHNDLAFDSSAFWLHVATGVKGSVDRWGRILPVLVIGIPLVALGGLATGALTERMDLVPAVIGLGEAALLCSLGVTSYVSARFPYPATKPGDGPFSYPQAAGASVPVYPALSILASALLTAPTLVLAIWGMTRDAMYLWATFGVGVGMGLVVLVIGTAAGARVISKRSPEMLAHALRN
jgi:ABC-2 type transport system permease protein